MPKTDRVDGGESVACAKWLVSEHLLDQPLAVVEVALDGQSVHVPGGCGSHLAALHFGDLFFGSFNFVFIFIELSWKQIPSHKLE